MRDSSCTAARARAALSRLVWPLISAAVALVGWELLINVYPMPSYVLPAPGSVLRALIAGLGESPASRASFIFHLADTLRATILGFVIGSVLGMALAAMMAEFRIVQRVGFPYVVGFQSLPKVAIAPLYVIWFGYQIESKVAMSATLTLFPVLLNSLQGFVLAERERLELMASLDASRWQTFRHIKFPGALPFVFAGLNLGIVYALLGTIVMEFIGAQRGMGVIVTQLQTVSDTAGVFAILLVLAATGYVLIAVVRTAQRRFTFWTSQQGWARE